MRHRKALARSAMNVVAWALYTAPLFLLMGMAATPFVDM